MNADGNDCNVIIIYLFISSLGQNTNTKKKQIQIQNTKKIPERIYG